MAYVLYLLSPIQQFLDPVLFLLLCFLPFVDFVRGFDAGRGVDGPHLARFPAGVLFFSH